MAERNVVEHAGDKTLSIQAHQKSLHVSYLQHFFASIVITWSQENLHKQRPHSAWRLKLQARSEMKKD